MSVNWIQAYVVSFIVGGVMLLVAFGKFPAEALIALLPLVLGYYLGEVRAITKKNGNGEGGVINK